MIPTDFEVGWSKVKVTLTFNNVAVEKGGEIIMLRLSECNSLGNST